MAFTGNKDVDRTILLRLDDYDLANICKTNTYFGLLCSEELLWKTKTLQRFGPSLGDIEQIEKYRTKYKYKTWRSYYISLIDFLEKKYLGYFLVHESDIRQRGDITELNTIIDQNNEILFEKISFFLFDMDEKDLDKQEFHTFMDRLLDKDLIDPNFIFIEMLRNFCCEKYFKDILEYLLNRQDRRIHPEYHHNDLLEKLAIYEYDGETDEYEYELFGMVLRDHRIDPNVGLYRIVINTEIPDGFSSLILQDPRIRLNDIRETIEIYIKLSNDHYVNGLLQLFEAFLQKGGSLSELENIVENESKDNIVYYRAFIRNTKNNLYIERIRKSKYEEN